MFLLLFGLSFGPPLDLPRVIIGGIMFPLAFFPASELLGPCCPVLFMEIQYALCAKTVPDGYGRGVFPI